MIPSWEKCGVIGIASSSDVSKAIYYGLRGIQHRGQESAGMVTYDGETKCIKDMGLVHEGF